VEFATSSEATWERNFRDLNGAVTRMCTVASGGRVTAKVVEEEIERLRRSWSMPSVGFENDDLLHEILGPEAVARLDLFDRSQLANVLGVVRGKRSLSEAGRSLFANSREKKQSSNDADRLRKYLARFGISWESVRERSRRS
jgi:transcriptional regulatory protein RtcR